MYSYGERKNICILRYWERRTVVNVPSPLQAVTGVDPVLLIGISSWQPDSDINIKLPGLYLILICGPGASAPITPMLIWPCSPQGVCLPFVFVVECFTELDFLFMGDYCEQNDNGLSTCMFI